MIAAAVFGRKRVAVYNFSLHLGENAAVGPNIFGFSHTFEENTVYKANVSCKKMDSGKLAMI
ncbi:hypothetical protein DQG23_34590 [Paenibacillus contaminans]|uniref:Uncharacterized protein n=1 Tax=Paenibacillus contaminans TaxID=450362 RepID=A0A329M180_9BACL|nr:hypothetical protein DQG23_34590 [Paenibacillus contaminans]